VNIWRWLPIPLAPAQHETLASWLHRLATVHGLRAADLRQHLNIGPHVTGGADLGRDLAGRLAAVTGHPAGGLALALPELRVPAPDWRSLRHLAQRACPRCTARHEGGPVRRLFTHHEYLCSQHGYWLGPPDPTRDDPPPQLAARLPELVTAQHRLRDAMVRYGWAALFDATVGATRICLDLRFSAHSRPLWTRWEQRLDLLMPAGYRRSLFMAAIFPEVATLAALICSPPWRAPAALSHPADAERFLCAAAHELDCPDTVGGLADAIMTWAATRATAPPLEPVSIYPQTSHGDDGSPRVTDAQRLGEQGTMHRFARDRRAPRATGPAAPLPYAHRPATAGVGAGRRS
jgi:hypothetical protein